MALELRAAMSHFATGVAVVTAADADGRPFGTTANAISSLSLDPPLILACLRRESETLAALRASRAFAVSVLAAEQRGLAERFARRTAVGSWDGLAHRRADGVPLLDEALATLECRLHELAGGGDHVIVIGRVVRATHPDDHVDPLLFYRGAYADLVARPQQPALAAPPPGPEIALPSALGSLRMLPLGDGPAVEASVAVLVGEPRGSTGTLVYLHRGCLLGDALGSRACGGRERLHAVIARLEREDRPGVIVYHRDGALGLGACCLGSGAPPPPSDGERVALREALRMLDLRDPVIVDDPAPAAAAA